MVWSLILPLIQVLVLTLVVGFIMGSGPANLSAYMLCAFLPWNLFQTSLLDASSSVLEYMNIIQKVYIPRELLVFTSIIANSIHFFLALAVFIVYRYGLTTVLFGWPGLPPKEVFLLPVVYTVEVGMIAGIGLILCAWTTFYEDIKYVAQVLLNLFFYLVPVLYFAENIMYSQQIPKPLRSIAYHAYLLVPMTWIVTAFKQMFFRRANIASRGAIPIMSAPFDYRFLAISATLSVCIFVFGLAYFNKMKWKFTERP